MQTPSSIRAVFFDLDGTLIDSESLTDRAVLYLLQKHALPANNLDLRLFHGTTWRAIALRLKALFPTLDDLDYTIEALSTHFFEQSTSAPPPLIPAAQEAFLAASSRFPTGIVTGSNADAVDHFLRHSGLESACSFVVSSEQYAASKPDPSCYQLAAEQLAIPPAQCLVFEDSTPGLQAAKAAEMPAIAVLYSAPPPPSGLAISSIVDYTDLPDTFFEQIGEST